MAMWGGGGGKGTGGGRKATERNWLFPRQYRESAFYIQMIVLMKSRNERHLFSFISFPFPCLVLVKEFFLASMYVAISVLMGVVLKKSDW